MGTGSSQASLKFLQPRQWLWKLTDVTRQFRQRKVMDSDAALGRRGEDLAHRYLQQAGFKVIARNYRHPNGAGEIDIVADHRGTLVFVEVKARTSSDYGAPDRAIDREKMERITHTARYYAGRAGIEWDNVRFDIVTIVFTSPPSIVHYEDAFFLGRVR